MEMAKRKSNQNKKKKQIREEIQEKNDTIANKIATALFALTVLLAFYLLTLYITNKNKEPVEDTNDTVSEEISSEILLGRSFNMSDSEYVVVYYDTKDEEIASNMASLIENYRISHGDSSIYYVDMNSGFNAPYATEEESNKNPSSTSELKINGPTLIKVDQHIVVEYVEGYDSIENYLQ